MRFFPVELIEPARRFRDKRRNDNVQALCCYYLASLLWMEVFFSLVNFLLAQV
jgi:hypothetical protein